MKYYMNHWIFNDFEIGKNILQFKRIEKIILYKKPYNSHQNYFRVT